MNLHDAGFFNPYYAQGTSPELRRALYRDWLLKGDDRRALAQRERLHRLRGKILCGPDPDEQASFADVLLELANA